MTNFEKCKSEFLIKDIGNGSFCKAINRVRNEDNCGSRSCTECRKWLKQEYKPQILDKAEKKYLSNIVRPFRDRVEGIVKPRKIFNPIECKYVSNGQEYIAIKIKHEGNITLPFFPEGTMYKGMKAGKLYTLEELGI